ncbi:cryptochrome/photolyase family protein [Streptomyces triticirhizae]|uniref:Deoxyribodipyrimidine photo-lyase n=1 Tax=Streptomyces triticirhizae TaxID=2483353 RepID=A0A3M2LRU4_9ACTN|nr:deoxyribodipyrimidine photo-lyase [Streptomyces triticirhizae]RMI39806.1 deoxyribodipyrimidine photo-lyase [Streptomyces triticirhizae]
MDVSIALFTANLRLRDNPVLRGALDAARRVVPLFVVDSGIVERGFAVPNRAAFLADALAELDEALRERGGRLVVRHGDVVTETARVAAETGAGEVHLAAGVSEYADRRERRLRAALEADGRALVVHDAVLTVVPSGVLTPTGKDHFAVFTPYFRRWERQRVRRPLPAPRSVPVPERVRSEPLPDAAAIAGGERSPGLARGGEATGRKRLTAWMRQGLGDYHALADDLAADATSRLSPHLHFGCLSPTDVLHAARRRGGPGADDFVRQLAWRDFHHQVLAARPAAGRHDYRGHGDRWRNDPAAFDAWREGRTGFPVVDAAMRQLRHEGWMHGRARLLVASFLSKTLYLDWRLGARHFLDLLVDGDLANNQLNWQWAAGTGTDTRPNRVLNPLTQARRFDPNGDYVRRWVPELAEIPGRKAHQPWRLPEPERPADYPEPIVDLATGARRFQRARG